MHTRIKKSYVAQSAFEEFKNYVGKITGQPEIANGLLIEPMKALCLDCGLSEVYFVVMQSYFDEQIKNSNLDDQVAIEYAKTLTPLQNAMLKKIALDYMSATNDGEPDVPEDTATWSDGIIESPEDKCVFKGMLNAGLVWSHKENDSGKSNAITVGLTAIGFMAYKRLGEDDEQDQGQRL